MTLFIVIFAIPLIFIVVLMVKNKKHDFISLESFRLELEHYLQKNKIDFAVDKKDKNLLHFRSKNGKPFQLHFYEKYFEMNNEDHFDSLFFDQDNFKKRFYRIFENYRFDKFPSEEKF